MMTSYLFAPIQDFFQDPFQEKENYTAEKLIPLNRLLTEVRAAVKKYFYTVQTEPTNTKAITNLLNQANKAIKNYNRIGNDSGDPLDGTVCYQLPLVESNDTEELYTLKAHAARFSAMKSNTILTIKHAQGSIARYQKNAQRWLETEQEYIKDAQQCYDDVAQQLQTTLRQIETLEKERIAVQPESAAVKRTAKSITSKK